MLAEGVHALTQLIHDVGQKVLVEAQVHTLHAQHRAAGLLVLHEMRISGPEARHGRFGQGPAGALARAAAVLGYPLSLQALEVGGLRG
jgi:hypothetical protein